MSARWPNLYIYLVFQNQFLKCWPWMLKSMITTLGIKQNPHIQYRREQIASKSLRYQGPIFWYKIPLEIKAKQTVKSFGYCLKRHIIETYPISWIYLLLILDCDLASHIIQYSSLHLSYWSHGLKCPWCPKWHNFRLSKMCLPMYFLI